MVVIRPSGNYDIFLKINDLTFLSGKMILLLRINNVLMFFGWYHSPETYFSSFSSGAVCIRL